MNPDELAERITSWQETLRVARAIDSRAYQQARGWDLADWTYKRETWGIYFVRHDRRRVHTEAVAVVAATGVGPQDITKELQGSNLPTRLINLTVANGSDPATAADHRTPAGSRAKQRSLWIQLGLLCVCFSVLTVATVFLRSRRAAERLAPGVIAQLFLYCPDCGLEMTCPPGFEERVTSCPHCGKAHRMEVNAFSRNSGDAPKSRANRTLLAVAFGVPATLAVAVYAAGRLRARRESVLAAQTQPFACPSCGHKMSRGLSGRRSTVVCPSCAKQFQAPDSGGKDMAAGDVAEVREWGHWLGSELTKRPGRA